MTAVDTTDGVKSNQEETRQLESRFAGRFEPIDCAIADRWGMIASEAKHKGRSLGVIDGLLAATAWHHNLTIATRNVSDFISWQVQVMNPWEA